MRSKLFALFGFLASPLLAMSTACSDKGSDSDDAGAVTEPQSSNPAEGNDPASSAPSSATEGSAPPSTEVSGAPKPPTATTSTNEGVPPLPSASDDPTPDAPPSASELPSATSTQPQVPSADLDGGAATMVGAGGVSENGDVDASAPTDSELDTEGPGAFDFGNYIMGADISGVPEQMDRGTVFVDTDGEEKDLLDLLLAHGFNMIRLRTFVDPAAAYGYASDAGDCQAKSKPYNDMATTVAFAQEIKAHGLGLLLDFHYSDTWADPGKQVIPEAWRDDASIEDLAAHVSGYTTLVLTELADAGATPDMVQVGNEITPGMLIHVPTDSTDCYGNNSTPKSGANGSAGNWDNLAALLTAGADAVRAVDPKIKVMLHIENLDSPQGVVSWVNGALNGGVDFDVLGLSAYEAFQGPSSAWQGTLEMLADTFPELAFAIAEYNPQRRLLNDLMRALPDGRGWGTFFWEPTQSGSWGEAMFEFGGGRATASAEDFAEYDEMRADYGL